MSVKSAHTNKITQIPEEFICPITLELMEDPVMLPDGHTFEREALMLIPNSLSPLTREPFNKAELVPNRSLKNAIDRFKEANESSGLAIPILLPPARIDGHETILERYVREQQTQIIREQTAREEQERLTRAREQTAREEKERQSLIEQQKKAEAQEFIIHIHDTFNSNKFSCCRIDSNLVFCKQGRLLDDHTDGGTHRFDCDMLQKIIFMDIEHLLVIYNKSCAYDGWFEKGQFYNPINSRDDPILLKFGRDFIKCRSLRATSYYELSDLFIEIIEFLRPDILVRIGDKQKYRKDQIHLARGQGPRQNQPENGEGSKDCKSTKCVQCYGKGMRFQTVRVGRVGRMIQQSVGQCSACNGKCEPGSPEYGSPEYVRYIRQETQRRIELEFESVKQQPGTRAFIHYIGQENQRRIELVHEVVSASVVQDLSRKQPGSRSYLEPGSPEYVRYIQQETQRRIEIVEQNYKPPSKRHII